MTEKTQCRGKPGLLPKGALFNELHGISPQLLPLKFCFLVASFPCFLPFLHLVFKIYVSLVIIC